jgi:hypothetical protein
MIRPTTPPAAGSGCGKPDLIGKLPAVKSFATIDFLSAGFVIFKRWDNVGRAFPETKTDMQAQKAPKNRHHRIIRWLLLLVVVLPSAVQAQFNFVTNNGAITITGYIGSDGTLDIPEITNGYPVTSIEGSYMPPAYGNYGYYGTYSDPNLTNVIIPGSITNIAGGVFNNFGSITAITVDEQNLFYSSLDGVLFDKQQTTLIEVPTGMAGSYAIPNSVTNIGSNAFYYCAYLTDITLGTNVTSIGSGAFAECYNWTGVAIPDSVASIGSDAFFGCSSLTNLMIGANVASIGDDAFGYCSGLTGVTIPNSVTNIGNEAFIGCFSLTNVNLGLNVANIGIGAFAACENLISIAVDEQSLFYRSVGGILFNEDQTVLVEAPGGFAGSYIVPDTVTNISAEAFYFCTNLTSITIPGGVINIASNTFVACYSLTSANIGTNVVSIGDNAFASCPSLTSITIPDSVTNIGNSAFNYCGGLTNAVIGANVIGIGDSAFTSCSSLTGIAIPNSVAYIGSQAFYSCGGLGSLTLGSNVTQIGMDAFASCFSLPSVIISDSVASIGSGAFDYCGSLTNVAIGANVTSIGSGAFNDCTNLTSLLIPNSVTNIGDGNSAIMIIQAMQRAMQGYDLPPASGLIAANCSSLTSIAVAAQNGCYSSANGILFDKNQTTLIEAPGGFAGNYTIPNGITTIGTEAFRNSGNLTGISIPVSVTNIGIRAFAECSNLAAIAVFDQNAYYHSVNGILFDENQTTLIQAPGSIVGNYSISNSVTGIKSYAFFGCPNLTGLTIPESVTNVGHSAFEGCLDLAGIFFEGNAPSLTTDTYSYPMPLQPPIGLGPNFYNPKAEAVYYLPGTTGWGTTFDGLPAYLWTPPFACTPTNGTITINGCISPTGAIQIPDTIAGLPVTTIASGAFIQSGNLTNVILGNNLTSIGSHAFDNCSNLSTITIPGSVTNIGSFAFAFCHNLNSVYFKGDAPSADSSVFLEFHIIFPPPFPYPPTVYPPTIYYLPGTEGWGTIFAGQPTVLWNPQVQTGDVSFGVRTNQFGFNIIGSSNLVIVVEACTNLASPVWTPVGTNQLNAFLGTNGSSYFSDPDWTNYSGRFYRFRSP